MDAEEQRNVQDILLRASEAVPKRDGDPDAQLMTHITGVYVRYYVFVSYLASSRGLAHSFTT